MYMTLCAGSPCAKTVSFPRNFPTFLPRPTESRNNFTSNKGLLKLAFLRERRRLTGLRRITVDMLNQNSMDFGWLFKTCPILAVQYWTLRPPRVLILARSEDHSNAIPSGSGALSAMIGAPANS